MDILKKELAPLSTRVWEEIESRAAEILRSRLSARKVVRVDGPNGWNFTAVPEGRLDLVDDTGDVKAGVFRVAPLSEARVRFTLNRWEMDNLNRGAKDIDLHSLDAAVEKIADFEEKAIYHGFKAGGIVGLSESAVHKPVMFGKDGSSIMESVSVALITLRASHAQGPCTLVVGTKAWMALNKEIQGIPLVERIERLIGGKVVHSLAIDGAFLLPYDNENLELTIGQDFAIGYESHDTKDVTLFLTESFTFRVLDPNLVVPFKV
ncbi:MAG: family 1 encapsulin nanocompartment shell protein [Sphaerochaeta sp.]|nr:family 1 encapsulin nanocompartment shell protein [Sphaerochaeta sp.]